MIKLFNEDCLTALKRIEDSTIDAVITDPPYGIDYISHKHSKIKNDKIPFIWFLYDAARVLKNKGCLLVFCHWSVQDIFKMAIECTGLDIKSQIIWDRQQPGYGDLKGRFAPQHDIIWFATKGRFVFPNIRPKSIISSPKVPPVNNIHPNEKPVALIERLILLVTNKGDTILDPFFGSGSCCVACQKTERNFIGMEIDNNYFNLAKNRLGSSDINNITKLKTNYLI